MPSPLLPFSPSCLQGRFLRREKRFLVEVALGTTELWIHSNNSGAMLGLTRRGSPVLFSPATRPGRKLPYTLEAVWLGPEPDISGRKQGFWVGVNTSIPNSILAAAFAARRLPFAAGYTRLLREQRYGNSRMDALCTAPGLPDLWIECKNVTMVEDNMACFPDAATTRGQKHLQELMNIVASGRRAAMFYLVQRPDGQCFGPAACVDPRYAELFRQALHAGVEIYPFRATVSPQGIDLGTPLPLAPCLLRDPASP